MITETAFVLRSFIGQDKNVDEAVEKADRKANEWLASSPSIELVSVTSTVTTNPNGKHLYVITLACKALAQELNS